VAWRKEWPDQATFPAEMQWSPQCVGLFTPNEMMEFVGSGIQDALPSWRNNPKLQETMIDLRERSLFTLN
jgi:hypothetical protein